ncbi:MAG: hypothetical protein ACPK85_04310 [Methanosarcina sp.]
MFFELQLSSQVFGRILRNRIKAIPPCIKDGEKDREINFDTTKYIVDHIDIVDSTTINKQATPTQTTWIFSQTNFTSFTVPYLQVKQGITVKLVKNSDLEQNGLNESEPSKEFTVFPVFNVSIQVFSAQAGQGGPVQIKYEFDHVEYGLLSALISPDDQEKIRKSLSGYQLTPTTIDLSSLSQLLNRPVSAINAGITCNSEGDFIALRIEIRADGDLVPEFFTQDPVNLLNGRDWALLADARIFMEEASQRIKDGLGNVSKFKLHRGPTVSWDPNGPALNINLGGEAVDACPFFVDDIDMDVDAEIRAILSVPRVNILRTHYHFDASASNAVEEVACAATAALLWPFIGLVMFDRDQIDLPKYLVGVLVHPLLRFVALIFAIETQGMAGDISRDLGSNCKKLNDEDYECEDEFELALAGLGGRLELQMVQGISQGPVLSGAIMNLRDFNIGKVTSVNLAPFKWQIIGQCKSGFSIGNQASISIGVEPPAALCPLETKILDDPLEEFELITGDNELTIVPKFKPEYMANPYPCRIRIITTRGVRTVSIAPPQAKTDQETQDLETGRLRAIASCERWEKVFTPKEKLEWLIDPPFDTREQLQFWQVVVSRLKPDNRVLVEDQTGKTILSAAPTETGVARLSLLFEGRNAPSELSLKFERLANENQEPRKIEVQQTLYVQRSFVPAPADLQDISFENENNKPILIYSSSQEEHKFDLSVPAGPTLKGITTKIENVNERTQVLHRGQEFASSIRDNALTLDTLRLEPEKVRTIGNPSFKGLRKTLYVGLEKGGTLFDLSNPEKPLEIQKYGTKPWFEDTVLSGRLLARHDPEKRKINIFEAVASRTI